MTLGIGVGGGAVESGAGVAGFVLAGGRSSRMGMDKTLVELGGRPLVSLALEKLRRVTGSAAILAGPSGAGACGDVAREAALAWFAPLLFDLHPGCGPLSGIEAALSRPEREWSLILPVDVPFLPAGLLEWWVERTMEAGKRGVRASVFRVLGEWQPGVLLLHRALAPDVAEAMARGEYKLMRMLAQAGLRLGAETLRVEELPDIRGELYGRLTEAERSTEGLWFANVNTPEELAEAQRHASALG